MSKIIILDRDGVINKSCGWVLKPEDIILEDGAAEAISLLNKALIKVVIATNQSPVGRGLISPSQLESIHEKLKKDLYKSHHATIDGIYFCPDHPQNATNRRKPGNGMLLEALKDFNARPEETPFVGDNIIDLQAAQKTGCPGHFVLTGHGKNLLTAVEQEFPQAVIHKKLLSAVQWLLGNHFV